MSLRAGRMAGILAVALLGWGAASAAGFRMEQELALEPGGRFVLDTAGGSVSVVGTDRSGARVIVTSKSADAESRYDFIFSETPGRAEVKVEKKGSRMLSWLRWGGNGLKFEIEVPRETRVDVDTSGGSIAAEALHGDARLDTSGGSIAAARIRGDVLADTSGGSIAVEDVEGDVEADTSGGGITIDNVRGNVVADTSGGSITMRRVSGDAAADTSGGSITMNEVGGRVRAETSGGTISATLVEGNSGGGRLSTSGGGIRVRLDPSAHLEVDARASGGSVASEVPMSEVTETSKTTLRARMGAGGETLRLRTSGGSIVIEPL